MASYTDNTAQTQEDNLSKEKLDASSLTNRSNTEIHSNSVEPEDLLLYDSRMPSKSEITIFFELEFLPPSSIPHRLVSARHLLHVPTCISLQALKQAIWIQYFRPASYPHVLFRTYHINSLKVYHNATRKLAGSGVDEFGFVKEEIDSGTPRTELHEENLMEVLESLGREGATEVLSVEMDENVLERARGELDVKGRVEAGAKWY